MLLNADNPQSKYDNSPNENEALQDAENLDQSGISEEYISTGEEQNIPDLNEFEKGKKV